MGCNTSEVNAAEEKKTVYPVHLLRKIARENQLTIASYLNSEGFVHDLSAYFSEDAPRVTVAKFTHGVHPWPCRSLVYDPSRLQDKYQSDTIDSADQFEEKVSAIISGNEMLKSIREQSEAAPYMAAYDGQSILALNPFDRAGIMDRLSKNNEALLRQLTEGDNA